MEKILVWLGKLTTGRDNKTPCSIRVMGWLSFFFCQCMYAYEVIGNGMTFDILSYCAGMGALFALISTGVAIKKSDEPEGK